MQGPLMRRRAALLTVRAVFYRLFRFHWDSNLQLLPGFFGLGVHAYEVRLISRLRLLPLGIDRLTTP